MKTNKFHFSGDLETDFEKLGLFNKGKATRAAELLLGNHKTTIHLGRFKTPITIIDDIIIKKPLVFAVEEAMTFIKKIYRLNMNLQVNFNIKTNGNTHYKQFVSWN